MDNNRQSLSLGEQYELITTPNIEWRLARDEILARGKGDYKEINKIRQKREMIKNYNDHIYEKNKMPKKLNSNQNKQ